MFGLNLQERRVILFLIFLLIIGLGLSYFKKTNSPLGFPLMAIYTEIENLNKVDLNTADKETLIRLPGIGERLALRIIEYRQKYGRFRELEELKNIKGLKSSCYEKIKDYLYIK